jgi:hypothetical protein
MKLTDTNFRDFVSNYGLKGHGIKGQPFEVVDFNISDRKLRIIKFHSFLRFFQGRLDIISMRACKNLEYRKMSLGELNMRKCSNISLNDCKIESLTMRDCYKVQVNNCEIKNLSLVYSYDNSFRNSIIDFAMGYLSRYNTFKFSDTSLNSIIEQCREKKVRPDILLSFLPIIFISAYLLRAPDFLFLPLCLFLGMFVSTFWYNLIKILLKARKLAKYQPNEIIE